MEHNDSSLSERPAKRVRQACEPCRKIDCGAWKESWELSLIISGMTPLSIDEEYDVLTSASVSSRGNLPVAGTSQLPSGTTAARSSASVILPPWDEIVPLAELYLLYCESQPLPLFHRSSFIGSIQTRDIEIIYAVLALSLRFSNSHRNVHALSEQVNSYAEVARGLVMKRVSEGPVEVSTLQCLCLLSLVDFTNGNTHRSSIHSSLAMNLAQCANLGLEPRSPLSSIQREERRRCFWSICLLKRLHGGDFTIDIPDGGGPAYPQSLSRPARMLSPGPTPPDTRRSDIQDQGILAYVIMLSEAFARTARYVRLRGRPSNVPPWSPHSEYSKIIALQMDLETKMPLTHRFKPANLSDRSREELQAHREYWGPWFLNQFMYHTMLCLLNHPLLLSLSLRTFRSTIPEIFLQHTSDLISSHTTWIIHFINYFEEKTFFVSDPLLGYSAAVVATIELQLSFTENPTIRDQKRDRFTKCVKFVQQIGEQWPHMARLAQRLQHLEDAVSATYQSDPNAQNQSLLIDLSRFWEILEYSSNSDADSARRLFGDSLYAGPSTANPEVSQTSPLPAPTRIGEERPASLQSPAGGFAGNGNEGGFAEYSGNSLVSPQQLTLTNDDFSILATNFFSQGQEFLRGGDTWTNIGNF
ncbi:hypothetical protein PENSUB_13002 [Penicillium subrubescens]|uniref:Xylanolytic transcriptional activator regulatory domain-containing protein n=1 Tax=Penicillium subrubescens TaxID=1316194 RepID=A0A1Q5SUQ1_9EURO|nr:hypothetical protein PENSUB_13002 [Penicillium subrubescens]